MTRWLALGRDHPAAAYATAVGAVLLATAVNDLLFPQVQPEVLVMVYLVAILPVGLVGNRGATVAAALMAVAALDYFFTPPYHRLNDFSAESSFTFLVMALVGLMVGTLTSRLAAEAAAKERRALEAEQLGRELAEANRELRMLDRLRADLLANVGHELRTPLTTIAGNAELLQDEVAGTLNPAQQDMIQQVQHGARQLERMVAFQLDFVRLDTGTFPFEVQEEDLRGLVADVVEGVRPCARGRGLALELELPTAPVVVEMDAQRIAQVLSNLLDNAIKFTPAGGRVAATLCVDADVATVQVRDTGIGIAPEHLPHVFTRFYQVDATSTRAFGGAGLGLAFSKALVEAHGGHVGVLSAPGQGSTFWFDLPRVPVSPPALARASGCRRVP
jgi:signal transduction histidine kinase